MKGELKDPLRHPAGSGVYRVPAAQGLEASARAAGLALAWVSLQGATDKESLLRTVAAALDFPDWFGGNWDALEDCLSDLAWRPAEAHLLVFEGHDALAEDVLATFIEILQSAAGKWAAEDARFFAVFIDGRRALPLPQLAQ